jgi:hypothetical protein
VSAVDRDAGENGRLRFTILSGDSRSDFAIGETSGILRINKQLDYERKNAYELTLQVRNYLFYICTYQGCQIFLGTTYQNGNIYQISTKFTK